MKVSDLPNPAAAAKAIEDFKKRFTTKVCLAPDKSNCTKKIISAHTLSVSAMLKPISRDGHVYAHNINFYKATDTGPTTLKLTGISDTSVFFGFCSHHDAQLFSPIENDNSFCCTHEQIFLHAFRAVAKESYLKRKGAESIPSEDLIKSIHNLPTETRLAIEDMLILQAGLLRGAEEIERLKTKFDTYFVDSNWRRIVTTIIPFKRKPNIVCNFVYSPDFDFAGNSLQDFEDFSKDLDQLMVTVLPSGNGGFALLSHLDTAGTAPRRLVQSLIARQDITTALIWLIVGQAENIAISPIWFDALTQSQRNALQEHFVSHQSSSSSRCNVLRECPAHIDNWENGAPFEI